jgi:transposase-like protein
MADGGGGNLPALKGQAGRKKYVRFSEAIGASICARVEAGESLSRVCRGPEMPHATTVYDWAREYPEFGLSLGQAMRTARIAQRMVDRAKAAARLAAGRDRRGRWSTFTPELGREICERIANGESLKAVGQDPTMPCSGTILRWAAEFPDFGNDYAYARRLMADLLFDEAREVALGATPGTVWADRLRFDTIRWMTARMAPKKYCERVVVEAEVASRCAADDPQGDGLTVVIRRFTDAPDPEAGEYPLID